MPGLQNGQPNSEGEMAKKVSKKKACPDCKIHKAEIRRLRRILKKLKDECAVAPMIMGFAIDLADEGLTPKK